MGLQIDPAFVQAAEHRPKSTISDAGSIPLIDLSPLLHHHIPSDPSDPSDPAIANEISNLIAQIGEACRDWGFFQVVNHGVEVELLEKVEAVTKEFFALPAEEKRKVKRGEVNPMGYYDAEHTKNVRDWKEVFDFSVTEWETKLLRLENQWPENLPEMRAICEEYYKDLVLGVGRHKDCGGLTILFQDEVGGLDIKRKTDGEWVRVKPIHNSFIINLGDIIQVWSNDKYESVEHRVSVNSKKDRYSIPFFFNPSSSTNVKPLEELVSEDNQPKYHEYNWGDFYKARKDSNFQKLEKENVQIYHFKRV
ncbi:Iron/ascorbate family oxidoreductases protein [Dioscorea alata]|uniref:Iron/ascorbate family oxidoreductases protein n=1 Tax=Dioscorea alata TaxID=55571 RepID=A0ACB7UKD9_DIOAL|nr:Iron/ascorbate family oxidoreductases protein [Dioscorea alata]